MKKLSKRMAALSTKIEDRIYAPLEALSIIKENANAKFDETIDSHIRLGLSLIHISEPPRPTPIASSAASDVYKRQHIRTT